METVRQVVTRVAAVSVDDITREAGGFSRRINVTTQSGASIYIDLFSQKREGLVFADAITMEEFQR